MLDWEWKHNPNVVALFLHCLLKANHEPGKWQGQDINRGQFITSYGNIAKETGLTFQQVRTCINKLKLTGELTSKTSNKFSIISITNYSEYQDYNKQVNNEVTNKEQTNNKQVTTNNKNNNNNNNNKKEINRKRFIPPTKTELINYINEKQLTSIDPDYFLDYYESNGWMVGRTKMKDWKATARGWHSRNKKEVRNHGTGNKHKSKADRTWDAISNLPDH